MIAVYKKFKIDFKVIKASPNCKRLIKLPPYPPLRVDQSAERFVSRPPILCMKPVGVTVTSKRLIGGFALTALSFAFSGGNALAQSTGSQDFEEIVVTAKRITPTVGAVITNETAAKSRASIGQDFIQTQTAGQSALQLINVIPGVNFTNNDAYGSSGGNLRIRSFDGNRISLTFDGMPLNDTGNYAIYSNQLLDSELLGAIQVNMGSTDVDSPTASATGGTVNYTLRKPSEQLDWAGSFAGGQNQYKRFFGALDSGAVGPWGTNFLLATSYQDYAKWRGLGDFQKRQINGRVYQPLGENGDFFAVAFHYNENRNNNFRAISLADYLNPARGREYEFDATCTVPTPGVGSQSQGDCGNFFGRQINPSNTGNIRGSSRFTVSDNFTLTIDPSFQYVLANGGGQFGRVWENGVANSSDSASRVIIGNTGFGRDLNGDGDTLDRVGLFTPSTTNTRRYGLTSSLIWDVMEGQRLRLAYTYDYGRHRQTGEYTFLNADGTTTNIFGGKDGWGQRILNSDGYHLRARDRFSIAQLNQVALEYRGEFLEDKLTVAAGIRAPFFERELNQFCFTEANSSSVLCTSLNAAVTHANGLVSFDFNKDGDVLDSGETTQYLRPYTRKHKYDEILPNIGISYKLTDQTQIFASYVEGLSAPRTDQLYTEDFNDVEPEATQTLDLGIRYNGGKTSGSLSAFTNKYKDRIQTAFDETTGSNLDRSIGDVDVWGVEAALGLSPIDNLDVYFSATYLQTELKDDIRTGLGTDAIFGTADDPFLPTAGKVLAESPEWTLAGRVAYSIGAVRFGVDAKWVDERFATDVNDQVVSAYSVIGFDASIDMEKAVGLKGVTVQLNGTNIFDEDYLGSISSRTHALAVATSTAAPSAPTYQPGAPQTFQLQVRKSF